MLSLPVEVEERVIDFVGAYFGLPNEWNPTLGQSCMATPVQIVPVSHITSSQHPIIGEIGCYECYFWPFSRPHRPHRDPSFEDERPDQQASFHLLQHVSFARIYQKPERQSCTRVSPNTCICPSSVELPPSGHITIDS